MRKNIDAIFCTLLVFGLAGFLLLSATSCSNQADDIVKNEEIIDDEVEVINSFNLADLERMKAELESQGIVVPDIELTEEDEVATTRGIFIDNPFVNAIKVSTKTLHPDRSGKYIDVSGVLLVPRKTLLTGLQNFRILVVPPHTNTYNNAAPSIAFQKMSLIGNDWDINSFYFWVLQAQSGYVVFMPDYPGFGDSYGQCFHPYLDSKSLVNSTIDLLKSAQKVLSANGYRYKKDIVISGYSQGAYTALSLAREIETNPTHGLSVNLLMTGGSPCDLKYIADVVRHSDYVSNNYLLAYGLWGYKENAYPNINISDFLLEPYASTSNIYFNGTYKDARECFPHAPSELYTEKFLTYLDIDPSIAYMNQILDENSVKPWKNKCKFVMTHAVDDDIVYYQNAKNFADEHNKAGGKVTFYSTIGDHGIGFVPYFVKTSAYLLFHK